MTEPGKVDVLFGYHQGQQLLVFGGEGGRPVAIPVRVLQACGWVCTDADFRASLPRFDQPLIQAAPAGALRNLPRSR